VRLPNSIASKNELDDVRLSEFSRLLECLISEVL
jgi:hypothetical protein